MGIVKRENIGQGLANADEAPQVIPLVKPGI